MREIETEKWLCETWKSKMNVDERRRKNLVGFAVDGWDAWSLQPRKRTRCLDYKRAVATGTPWNDPGTIPVPGYQVPGLPGR